MAEASGQRPHYALRSGDDGDDDNDDDDCDDGDVDEKQSRNP